jgi:hypothetical protein
MNGNNELYYESHMHKSITLTQEMHDKSIKEGIASAIEKIDYEKIIAANPRKPFDNEYMAKLLISEAARIARG